jgi:hypothetical protein
MCELRSVLLAALCDEKKYHANATLGLASLLEPKKGTN